MCHLSLAKLSLVAAFLQPKTYVKTFGGQYNGKIEVLLYSRMSGLEDTDGSGGIKFSFHEDI